MVESFSVVVWRYPGLICGICTCLCPGIFTPASHGRVIVRAVIRRARVAGKERDRGYLTDAVSVLKSVNMGSPIREGSVRTDLRRAFGLGANIAHPKQKHHRMVKL